MGVDTGVDKRVGASVCWRKSIFQHLQHVPGIGVTGGAVAETRVDRHRGPTRSVVDMSVALQAFPSEICCIYTVDNTVYGDL